MLCKVHYFGKKTIFHDIFQIGACPNLKDSSLYERYSIHMYKAWSVEYLQQFSSICDSLMPCTVHLFRKRDFSLNISSWCMPQLERFLFIWQVFYPYVQVRKHSVSATIFLYLRVSYALYGTFFWKKMIFQEIFQFGARPNLNDSLLNDRFSIHMYKARSIRYLQQFSSICDSLMPGTVLFWEKDEFLIKYFKLVHASTWKIP